MKQRRNSQKRRLQVWAPFLCLLVASAILLSPVPGQGEAGRQTGGEGKNTARSGTQIVVSYFYTTVRCSTCRKLETYSRQAVEEAFAKELNEKRIVFRTLNVDDSENKHYLQDYQLHTKSLIVSETRNGRETRWKNLPGIWKHVRDPDVFKKYVREEIEAYLKDR